MSVCCEGKDCFVGTGGKLRPPRNDSASDIASDGASDRASDRASYRASDSAYDIATRPVLERFYVSEVMR
jgi:hypothetical protein